MAGYLNDLLTYSASYPHMVGLVAFLASLLESLAIVGAVVPGSVLLVGIGALVPAGAANLWAILAWAVAGAVAGDGLSYWLGYRYGEIEILPMTTALGIGFCQTLALIPGVSRAGATILGAELLGVDRRIATEFSFYLAIPTMLGATVFDLWKSRAALTVSGIDLIAIGFITAFVVAIPVVRGLIGFVGRHGLVPFAWYRIALGLGWALWLFHAR